MPPLPYPMPSHRGQAKCTTTQLVPLLAWICGITATLSLRYGYYGNRRLLLGPNSSRMVEASSVFVEQLLVRGDPAKTVAIYGFSERPELSREINWTVSDHLLIDSYGRQGFSMWLNRGSKVRMQWEVVEYGGGGFGGGLILVLIKGEENFVEVKRYYISSKIHVNYSRDGDREAEYDVDNEDSYYFGVENLNPRSIMTALTVNVSSKSYDISKATEVFYTSNGQCKVSLLFPRTRYFVLTTPTNDVPRTDWSVELSLTARLAAYLLLLGFVVVIVYLILRKFEACAIEETVHYARVETESDPILPRKESPCSYGTIEGDPKSSLGCPSDDLYDGKICVICYDEKRDCFFIPCGHSATCYTCGQRIMEEESKLCPICRRLIHKTRRLIPS